MLGLARQFFWNRHIWPGCWGHWLCSENLGCILTRFDCHMCDCWSAHLRLLSSACSIGGHVWVTVSLLFGNHDFLKLFKFIFEVLMQNFEILFFHITHPMSITLFKTYQEITDGRRVLCANVVLDRPHEALAQRVANRVHDDARGGHLRITGFPDYTPVIAAIRDAKIEDSGKSFQVSLKKHDRLVVLQSLAGKWLDTEFKDEVVSLIEDHNSRFNKDGEFWHETAERLTGPTCPKTLDHCFQKGIVKWVTGTYFCCTSMICV